MLPESQRGFQFFSRLQAAKSSDVDCTDINEAAGSSPRNDGATANTTASPTTFVCDRRSFEFALHVKEPHLAAASIMPNVKDEPRRERARLVQASE